MERMIESRDIKHMACVERIKQLEQENKKLKENYTKLDKVARENVRTLDELEAKRIELEEDNKRLEEENKKLKSDLSECECSFGFENDEVGFWKSEYKRLKKWIKDHCKGYGNLFPEDEMKRQWKKADKKRK